MMIGFRRFSSDRRLVTLTAWTMDDVMHDLVIMTASDLCIDEAESLIASFHAETLKIGME